MTEGNLKCEDLDDLFKEIHNSTFFKSALDSIDLEKISDSCQGFDTMRLLRVFWSKARDFTLKKIAKDVFDLLSIGIMRGDIRKDQLVTTHPYWKIRIEALAATYGIRLRSSRVERMKLTPDTLTFSRMMSLFPLHASFLIHRKPDMVVKHNLSGKYGSQFCPAELKHSGAAAIIPKNLAGTYYLVAHVGYMLEISEQIDRSETDFKARYDNQLRLATIAHRSIDVSDVDRVASFKVMGLDKMSAYKNVIKACNMVRAALGKEEISSDAASVQILNDVIIISDSDEMEIAATALSKKMMKNGLPASDDIASSPMKASSSREWIGHNSGGIEEANERKKEQSKENSSCEEDKEFCWADEAGDAGKSGKKK